MSLFYEREKHSIPDLDLNISILDLNIISKKVLKLISQIFSTYEYESYQGHELNQHSLWLHKMCPYSEIFWSVFSRIRTEYGEIRSTSPCSVQMRENMDHNMDHMLFTVTFFFEESVVNMLELSTRMHCLAKNWLKRLSSPSVRPVIFLLLW